MRFAGSQRKCFIAHQIRDCATGTPWPDRAVAAPRGHAYHVLFGYRYLVFSMLALLAFDQRLRGGSPRWMMGAGALTGLAFVFRQDPPFAASCGVAAGLLARALGADGTLKQENPSGAVLESLGVRVAALDRNGTIIAVSAGWTDFARLHGLLTPDAVGRGVNYLDVTRRAAANGCTEAAIALKGIESVCTGASNTFESAYAWDALGEERWSLMTVTPLRRRAGGAVIVHHDLTHPLTLELARRMSGKQ